MGKTTHSATADPDEVAAAADVRNEHLRTQVDDLGESVSALETQQTHLQKTIDTLHSSNTAFQTNLSSQFTAFQSLLLDELRLLKSNSSTPQTTTHTATHHTVTPSSTPIPPPHRPLNPNASPSFCSLFAPPNAQPSSLGLSYSPAHTSATPYLYHPATHHSYSHHTKGTQPYPPSLRLLLTLLTTYTFFLLGPPTILSYPTLHNPTCITNPTLPEFPFPF